MEISPATAYLWFSFLEEIQDETLIAEYRRLLPSSERDKLGRYRFDRHKKRYLVGRALIRTVLSSCTGVAPDQITLARETRGRPYLLKSGKKPAPQFSLSYTDGLVAVALTSECRVGVDIENTTRDIDCLEIAESYFAPAEYMELKQLPQPLQKERFFEFWTLKEAYMKAQGSGLQMPLDEVSFSSGDKKEYFKKWVPLATKDGRQWQFRTFKPSERYRASLCVHKATEISLSVISKKVIPLVKEDAFTMSME